MPRTGKYGRIRQLIEILLRDPTALSEVLSGLFLVSLRGLLLIGYPKIIGEGTKLADLMGSIGITDQTWGTYLMVCGLLQVWFADKRDSGLRVLVSGLIVLGFASMVAGFWLAYGAHDVPPSIICMAGFEIFLWGRVGEEWWEYRKDRRDVA